MARPRVVPLRSKAAVVRPEYQADFLKHFVTKEIRVVKRPEQLSVEEHAAHRKKLARVSFIKPKFSTETEINLGVVFGKWKRHV